MGAPERWQERRVLAAMLRVVAMLLPISAAVVTSAVLGRTVPRHPGAIPTVARWVFLMGLSSVALILVERVSRRLLPLATLLSLSIVFPDRAPSRFRLARHAGSTRVLERRVEEARSHGLEGEPERAAESVLTLIAALGNHDRRTRGHSERVRTFTDLIGEELGLDADERDRLRWAALLHDVGKLMVSSELLNKPGKPTEDEWAQLHRHPIEGARLAAPLAPWLGEWATAIEHHHERFDGKGYPYGLAGRDISLAARVVAVADSYETMTAVRSYKKPMSAAAARLELTRCAGTQFDPVIVRAFLNVSIGRLWWRTGPLAWLAQIPFLGWLPRVGEGAAAFATAGGRVVTGAVAGATALGVGVGPVAHSAHAAARDRDAVVSTTIGNGVDTSATTADDPTSSTSHLPGTTGTSTRQPTAVGPGDSSSSSSTTRRFITTTTTRPTTVDTTDDSPEFTNPFPDPTLPHP